MKARMSQYFMKVCEETSKLSTCQSRQVGAVLIREDRILAIGYNGVPKGMKHCCDMHFESREKHSEWSNLHELHAEQNLVSFCAKEGIPMKYGELIISLSPCIHCAKIILSTGLNGVYYLEEYDRDKNGIEFLNKNGLKTEKLKPC